MILRLARDDEGTPIADGQLITQGYVVAQIAPTGSLIADVDLVGMDVARVRSGMPARVRHHAWEGGRTFDGRVLRLAPTLDPMTRTLRAEVAVENPERTAASGDVRRGHADRGKARGRSGRAARGGRRARGAARSSSCSTVRRSVAARSGLGLGDDEIIEIRQGVEPGERVVVRGLETLTDGTSVRPSGA